MMTGSPTWIGSELASGDVLAPAGTRSSWSRERSAAGSEATTRAFTGSPPTDLTVMDRIGVGERRCLGAGGHALELEQGEVRRRLGGDHARLHGLAPQEFDADLVHGVHDV